MDGHPPLLSRRMLSIVLSYLLLLLVGCLDYVSGHEMRMGTLYLLTVAVVSWNLHPRHVVFYVLATVALWSCAEYFSGLHFSQNWLVYWNAFNHLGVIAITAAMVSKVKYTLGRQQRLIRDLGQTLLKVSQFKELVPVCRLCHQLHVDAEYRARLDELAQEGADMGSIGNVCPDCLAQRANRIAHIPVEPFFQTDAT